MTVGPLTMEWLGASRSPSQREGTTLFQSGRNGLRSGPRGLGFTLAHCPGLALRAPAWPPVCPVFPQCILNLIYSLSSLPGCRSSTPPAPIFYFLTPSFHFLALFLEKAWWEITTLPKTPESELRGLERERTGTSGQSGRAPGGRQQRALTLDSVPRTPIQVHPPHSSGSYELLSSLF